MSIGSQPCDECHEITALRAKLSELTAAAGDLVRDLNAWDTIEMGIDLPDSFSELERKQREAAMQLASMIVDETCAVLKGAKVALKLATQKGSPRS